MYFRDRNVWCCTMSSFVQTGIGTYTSPQLLTRPGIATAKLLDLALAWNLESHVMSTSSLNSAIKSGVDVRLMLCRRIRVPYADLYVALPPLGLLCYVALTPSFTVYLLLVAHIVGNK